MGYLVTEQIKKYSKRLDFAELTSLSSGITCFSPDLVFNNLFLGAKLEMYDDTLSNFGTLTIFTGGTQYYLGQYEETVNPIAGTNYCLFGNICNSANGFGFLSDNLFNTGISLIASTSPPLSNPSAYAILTIYLTL